MQPLKKTRWYHRIPKPTATEVRGALLALALIGYSGITYLSISNTAPRWTAWPSIIIAGIIDFTAVLYLFYKLIMRK